MTVANGLGFLFFVLLLLYACPGCFVLLLRDNLVALQNPRTHHSRLLETLSQPVALSEVAMVYCREVLA